MSLLTPVPFVRPCHVCAAPFAKQYAEDDFWLCEECRRELRPAKKAPAPEGELSAVARGMEVYSPVENFLRATSDPKFWANRK